MEQDLGPLPQALEAIFSYESERGLAVPVPSEEGQRVVSGCYEPRPHVARHSGYSWSLAEMMCRGHRSCLPQPTGVRGPL